MEENGLKFEILLGKQQNTGLFLDMQPLRVWLRENRKGIKRYLTYSLTHAHYLLRHLLVVLDQLLTLTCQKQV
ncbi:MAG: hypothetical protein Ct9H90mP25_6350 [Gammaproteobacteria bacterium]|nr:MAG: hypothetical protein Ct9H90mP25_6350 [Gammaproteobacteria bacterium]